MKTFLSIIFFLAIGISLASQNIINNPFERQNEFLIHQDSTKHTQIKPYFYSEIIKRLSKKNHSFCIGPVYSIKQSYDIKTKKTSNNYSLGASLKASYEDKLYFSGMYYYGYYKPETFFSDYSDSSRIVPGWGKVIKKKKNNFRYNNFIMNLTYKPKDFIYFELGNGKIFLGDGYRSLLLSDVANPYPYFRAVAEVWKIKYMYMAAQQKNYDLRFPKQNFTKKYTFTHFLSLNIGKRLNISLFETVVTSPYDSLMAKRGLELNYFNPVIFMRPVEYSLGSPDNVLVGFAGHLKIFKSGMLYGQIFVDEFIRSHIVSLDDEYWDEKYGIQAGMKFYNTLGIKNLYTQGEINAVRPYTYSHLNPIRNYGNMYQSLAHPLGSNFIEILGIVEYQFNNFVFQIKTVYAKYGENDTLNYGRNPNISYVTRTDDKGVKWLQGVPSVFKYADFMIGYKKWDTQFSLNFIYRNVFSKIDKQDNLMIMLKIETPIFTDYLDYN